MESTTLADALRECLSRYATFARLHRLLSALAGRGNPVVFFDVAIGGRAVGRIKMELFKDIAPRVRVHCVRRALSLLAPHPSLFLGCVSLPSTADG